MKPENLKAISGDYDAKALSEKIERISADPVIKFLKEELFNQILTFGDTTYAGVVKTLVNKRVLEIRDEKIPEK